VVKKKKSAQLGRVDEKKYLFRVEISIVNEILLNMNENLEVMNVFIKMNEIAIENDFLFWDVHLF